MYVPQELYSVPAAVVVTRELHKELVHIAPKATNKVRSWPRCRWDRGYYRDRLVRPGIVIFEDCKR